MGPVIRPVLNPAKKLFFRCYGAEIFLPLLCWILRPNFRNASNGLNSFSPVMP